MEAMKMRRTTTVARILINFLVIAVGFAAIDAQLQIKSNFSCQGRPSGYYADVDSGCQIYHMCDGLGRQFSYSCPNTTLFQQRMLICDHWYMVNCSKSETDYGANLLIGQREKPFVEDSEQNPYHRTPRPDLLSHPSAPEYDIVYRTGRAQYGSNLNLVGADPSSTIGNVPAYSVPSHWSTKYYADATTPLPPTPSLPPRRSSPIRSTTKPPINSIVRPTEPRKPDAFDKGRTEKLAGEKQLSHVNFPSTYTATTPVYPLKVDVVPPSIADDQLPPLREANEAKNGTEPIKSPSKYFEPPAFVVASSNDAKTQGSDSRSQSIDANLKKVEWKELRKMFLIPDYEFPLDQVSRPGYGDGPSSFQVNPLGTESKAK